MPSASADTVVLIPIRSFDDTKSRLARALDADDRRALSMWMAERVVGAALGLPVRVVTDDRGVVAWAQARTVEVISPGVRGLNPSVDAAAQRAARLGFRRVIVAHADLPAARDLTVADRDGVCIVPDRARDGSNVLCVPATAGFRFAYGPQSFERHCAEAERLELALSIVDDDDLAWDVDDPGDLPADWQSRVRRERT